MQWIRSSRSQESWTERCDWEVWRWPVEAVIPRGNLKIEVSCPHREQRQQSTRILYGEWNLEVDLTNPHTSHLRMAPRMMDTREIANVVWCLCVCLFHIPWFRAPGLRMLRLLLYLQVMGTGVFHFVWISSWKVFGSSFDNCVLYLSPLLRFMETMCVMERTLDGDITESRDLGMFLILWQSWPPYC